MKKHVHTLLALIALVGMSQPALAADELMTGVSNEWVLISLLGGGILLLFICIMALAFMLYKAVPILVNSKSNKS